MQRPLRKKIFKLKFFWECLGPLAPGGYGTVQRYYIGYINPERIWIITFLKYMWWKVFLCINHMNKLMYKNKLKG